ncbi:MAG: hypothetical protein RBT70_09335 [Alphaproteobacteria bacterium]|jgi:hypothetical protein|nr:hypothetical protein [Alphaproteobacteria bacterium]
MDQCKLAVDSLIWGFGAAALYVCVKEGLEKWANARQRNAERRAVHAKGEPYWQDVDWVARVKAAGMPPERHNRFAKKKDAALRPVNRHKNKHLKRKGHLKGTDPSPK